MCRLFGLLGSAATPAAQWLVSSDRSLLRQSNGSSRQLQDDGWGIAWFDGSGELTVEKGVGGAHASGEVGRFKAAADRAVGPVVLAHLRKASNPMRLPKDRLIALENSQPFTFGRTMFAHNGSILHPRETRPLLGRYEREVRGVNDSEVLFALLLRNLDETREPVAAYAKTVGDLFQVWHRLGAPKAGPYSGLNVLFSRNPGELWAFSNARGEHGPGLLDSERPYYELAYRADAKSLLVGSEPFDSAPGWRSLPNGQFLHGQMRHGLVAVSTGTIPLPLELKAIA